ncbi:hypothetical protein TRFO_41377 [Tritrichomonas foetus]|uniref:Elastase-1 n=1 Tax=Tritrichomonas foetus TaxID=1144522 RepID=A0A1J4L0H0_9EUKA|nr:hypothetical protein TRFO_41377 [Tritrichomonas foetus]|eukprot:OHT16999.1 hypothetical protein TRFO_41377 [Tritrichomonas foetus]
MSIVKNQPRYKNSLLQAIRGTLEHRAMWLALLVEEAEKKGLKPEEYAGAAIKKCGCIQGKELVDKTKGKTSLKGLKKNLFTIPAQFVFEMKILESTDDNLSIDFHYCPLVAAWQKMGLSDEKIAQLCDIAMDGDRGIASQYGCKLNLGKVISKGEDICQIRFERTEPIIK